MKSKGPLPGGATPKGKTDGKEVGGFKHANSSATTGKPDPSGGRRPNFKTLDGLMIPEGYGTVNDALLGSSISLPGAHYLSPGVEPGQEDTLVTRMRTRKRTRQRPVATYQCRLAKILFPYGFV